MEKAVRVVPACSRATRRVNTASTAARTQWSGLKKRPMDDFYQLLAGQRVSPFACNDASLRGNGARNAVFLGPRIDEVHARQVSRIDLVIFVEPAL